MSLSRHEQAFERRFRRKLNAWTHASVYPGILICGALTILALYGSKLPFPPFTLSSGLHPISEVMLALLLGILIRNLFTATRALRPGIQFIVKTILPTGIFLLGAGLDIYDVLEVGPKIVIDSILVIVITLLGAHRLSRWLRVDEKQGILLNLGTAICGNAAIVVAAPMIRAEDRDVAVTIAIVNLMGVIAMFAFPLIGALLALSPAIYGMWCGLSIQVTAHVLAAGFAFPLDGDAAGQMATITKLTRISFLGPTVFIVAGWYTYRKNRTDPVVGQTFRFTQFIPAFVILFFVMVILRTIGCFPEVTFHFTDRFVLGGGDVTFDIERGLGRVSVWLITCGMAGIGLMTEFRTVREGGWRPVLLGVLTGLAVYGIGLALAMRQVRQAI